MGIANIYAIYRLGTILWDRPTGIFAAALLAFAGFHIWHSQEARMYSLLCLTGTTFALATVLFLRRPSRLNTGFCGLAGATLLYSHPFGALDWAAIDLPVALALIRESAWPSIKGRTWFAIQGLVALAYVPWAFAQLGRIHEVLNEDLWIPFPTFHLLYWMARAFFGGAAMLCVMLLLIFIVLVVSEGGDTLAGGVPLRPLRVRWRIWDALEWQQRLLLAWGVLPFVGGYILSIVIQPILQERYLIGSMSALLLLAARGLWILQFNRFALAGAVAALVASSMPAVYRAVAVDETEDGRAAVAAFSEQFQRTDGVIFSSPGVSNVFRYYFRVPVPFETVVFHPETDQVEWPKVIRVWVFAREGIEVYTGPMLRRIAALYQLQQVFHFHNFALYLFARPTSEPRPMQAGGARLGEPRVGEESPGTVGERGHPGDKGNL